METAPANASPCASVSPSVKQRCGGGHSPGKRGEGTRVEPVFLKLVPQPGCCKVPLVEGGQ